MFKIEPNAFYTTRDLQGILEAQGFTVRWFLDKCRPRKFDRSVWLGSDLLEAARQYTAEREAERFAARPILPLRRGRPRKAPRPPELIPLPER